MAEAIEGAVGSAADIVTLLHDAADREGAAIGEHAKQQLGPRAGRVRRLDATCRTLAEYDYEPRRVGGNVELANCPFHTLAKEHTDLVCGMNLALLEGVVDKVGDG